MSSFTDQAEQRGGGLNKRPIEISESTMIASLTLSQVEVAVS
jgi:hypothetical protein